MITAKSHPCVSILIPVFNREKFIGEAIQSALNQTYSDFEIVIVDNASVDGTWEVCREFSDKYPNIRIFRNDQNIGPVRNWQRCVAEARGGLCKILFSDDTLEPDCLAKMVSVMEDSSVAFVYSAVVIGAEKGMGSIAYARGMAGKIRSRYYVEMVVKGLAPLSPGAVLIRANDLMQSIRLNFSTFTPRPYDKHGAGPDLMIMLLTCEKYQFVWHIASPLVYFRAHSDSLSVANIDNGIANAYESVISLYLKSNSNLYYWVRYVAACWTKQTMMKKKWIDPKTFLVTHEGGGRIAELIVFLVFAFYFLIYYYARNMLKTIYFKTMLHKIHLSRK